MPILGQLAMSSEQPSGPFSAPASISSWAATRKTGMVAGQDIAGQVDAGQFIAATTGQ